MSDEVILSEIQETLQGVTLGLGATSEILTQQYEVLSKMLRKQEEEEEEEEEEEAAMQKSIEQEAMIKSIVKALEDSGKFVLKGDEPKPDTISTKPETQQDVIQAADPVEDEEDEEKKSVTKMKKQDDEDKEEEKEEEKEYPEVEKLKKELEGLKKSMLDNVDSEVDKRLRKMGWKQEKGLVGPKRVAMGVEDENRIKKSSDEDREAQLAGLSWSELVKLRMASEADELDPAIKQFLA